MVLLTSSAISIAISSGVVCTFTFLLFLSGYVLQQQTVRSLQEALRRPPEPIELRRIPSSPPTFKPQNDESRATQETFDHVVVEELVKDASQATALKKEPGVVTNEDTLSTKDFFAKWASSLAHTASAKTDKASLENDPATPNERLAYLLALPRPSSLCSALLFAKSQRQTTHLSNRPAIILLYPSSWETSSSSAHIAALAFMRDVQDKYALTYHPVEVSSVWEGVSIETQLLGEVERNIWDYDRAMYLKSPGLALDMSALDVALRFSNLKKSWTPLSSSKSPNPDVIMISRSKGAMTPANDLRKLTAAAVTSHANHHETEMDLEAFAKNAAYVHFDEKELEHRKGERDWYGGLFERFERGRKEICNNRGLLDDDDKLELRRRSKLRLR